MSCVKARGGLELDAAIIAKLQSLRIWQKEVAQPLQRDVERQPTLHQDRQRHPFFWFQMGRPEADTIRSIWLMPAMV